MKEEAKKLARFNTRMGMYIFPSEKRNIEAFLHGFELGNGYKFKLTGVCQHCFFGACPLQVSR